MDPACWRRVEGILESADERQGSEREAFLAAACDGDEELRREVAPCRSGPNTRRLRLQAVALRPPLGSPLSQTAGMVTNHTLYGEAHRMAANLACQVEW